MSNEAGDAPPPEPAAEPDPSVDQAADDTPADPAPAPDTTHPADVEEATKATDALLGFKGLPVTALPPQAEAGRGSFVRVSGNIQFDFLQFLFEDLQEEIAEGSDADRANLWMVAPKLGFAWTLEDGNMKLCRLDKGLVGLTASTRELVNHSGNYITPAALQVDESDHGYRVYTACGIPVLHPEDDEVIAVLMLLNKLQAPCHKHAGKRQDQPNDVVTKEEMLMKFSSEDINLAKKTINKHIVAIMDVKNDIQQWTTQPEYTLQQLVSHFKCVNQSIARQAADLVEAEEVQVVMHDSSASTLLYINNHGRTWRTRDNVKLLAQRSLIAQHVVNTGDGFTYEEFNHAEERNPIIRTRSILSVPIVQSQGITLGAIVATNKTTGKRFSRANEKDLIQMARRVSLQYQIEKLQPRFLNKSDLTFSPTSIHQSHGLLQKSRVPDFFPWELSSGLKYSVLIGVLEGRFMRLPNGQPVRMPYVLLKVGGKDASTKTIYESDHHPQWYEEFEFEAAHPWDELEILIRNDDRAGSEKEREVNYGWLKIQLSDISSKDRFKAWHSLSHLPLQNPEAGHEHEVPAIRLAITLQAKQMEESPASAPSPDRVSALKQAQQRRLSQLSLAGSESESIKVKSNKVQKKHISFTSKEGEGDKALDGAGDDKKKPVARSTSKGRMSPSDKAEDDKGDKSPERQGSRAGQVPSNPTTPPASAGGLFIAKGKGGRRYVTAQDFGNIKWTSPPLQDTYKEGTDGGMVRVQTCCCPHVQLLMIEKCKLDDRYQDTKAANAKLMDALKEEIRRGAELEQKYQGYIGSLLVRTPGEDIQRRLKEKNVKSTNPNVDRVPYFADRQHGEK